MLAGRFILFHFLPLQISLGLWDAHGGIDSAAT